MKNLIILFLLLITIKSYAQEYPLKTSAFDVPSYSYMKDTNNEYDKYIGLWKGNWNGKTVYIEFRKVKYYSSIEQYYSDELFGERKIIAADGTVEMDRITNFDYQHPEIFGTGLPTSVNGVTYLNSLMFYPKSMCDMFARLVVTNITPNQMTLHMVGMLGHKKENCIHDAYVQQHGEYPVNFPKDIVLMKQ